MAKAYELLLRCARHLVRRRRRDPLDALVETARRLDYGAGSPAAAAEPPGRADGERS
ncbi:hypothetical protein [Streptomyces glaucescens]|uniref:Uncharacterized protein n=1 Tax=Streptomyces glaucescens TaxID=1907 RepID=A0A089X8J3_STRGA|nr:hypothetical protein [Streptomyces glaucescens]AIR99523.1 hypothetical protein SGLAU_17800 [Streptomyces glaucescens]